MAKFTTNKKYAKNPFPNYLKIKIDLVEGKMAYKIYLFDEKNKCELDHVVFRFNYPFNKKHAIKNAERYKSQLIINCC